MNNFERVAIFTIIENMESQLRGLKSLIAASGNAQMAHKTTKTIETDDNELTDDEDAKLEQAIKDAREAEIQRMSRKAESTFQKEWDNLSVAMSLLDGDKPKN